MSRTEPVSTPAANEASTATAPVGQSRTARFLDAFAHRGPGYDVTPAAHTGESLARLIREQPVSVVQAAFRELGLPVRFEVTDLPTSSEEAL